MRRFIPILLLLFAIVFISQNEADQAEPMPAYSEYPIYTPDGELSWFHSFKGEHYLADISIGKVVLRGENRPMDFVLTDGIDFKVFQDGVLLYRLECVEVVVPAPYQTATLKGMTHISAGESHMEIEDLHFDPRAEMAFSTEKFIQITSGNHIVEGEGARMRLDFDAYEIDKVKGMIELPEEVQ